MSGHGEPIPMTARKSGPLKGRAEVPGDKSISHRSLILGANGGGRDEGHRASGRAGCARYREGHARPRGRGDPARTRAGEAGRCMGSASAGFRTGRCDRLRQFENWRARRLMGAMATTAMSATFTGDASLRKRPMGRVMNLALFGARALWPAGRAVADDRRRRCRSRAGALCRAGALGAGEIGRAARGPQCARPDRRDRKGTDTRPFGADAARLRRRN